MGRPRTGAERYIAEKKKDPEFRAAYEEAARRIRAVDRLVRSIDEGRAGAGLSKAELARRAGIAPEAVRRLFSVDAPNPTASTLVALASALDLEVVARPTSSNGPQGGGGGPRGTRRGSASAHLRTVRRRANSSR